MLHRPRVLTVALRLPALRGLGVEDRRADAHPIEEEREAKPDRPAPDDTNRPRCLPALRHCAVAGGLPGIRHVEERADTKTPPVLFFRFRANLQTAAACPILIKSCEFPVEPYIGRPCASSNRSRPRAAVRS